LYTRPNSPGLSRPILNKGSVSPFLYIVRKSEHRSQKNGFAAASFVAQLVLLALLAGCALNPGSQQAQPSVSLNLAVSPTTLNLGNVTVSDPSGAQPILVSNNGSESITVNNIAASGPFAFAGKTLPTTLNAGQSMTVNVTFAPTASGAASGSLTITSTAANSPTVVTLKGNGVASSSPLDLTVAPGSLSFGSVTVSDPSPAQPILISNNSSGTITVNNIGVSAPFASVGNILPTTLAAGQSMTVNVTFAPTASGAASGSLTITSTAANSPTAVALKGTGVASSSPLDLTVAPGSLSFGSVTVSDPSPAQPILVSNNSSGSITVNSIAVSAPFASVGNTLPMTLTAGQSMTVNVTFAPIASGAANGSLTIISTAANSPSVVTLKGTGVASSSPLDLTVAPGSLSFGSVTINNPSPAQPILISNNSSGTITVNNIGVSAPFASVGNTSPMTLTAGQNMTVNVMFTPTASGAASGTLTITSTAANSPSVVTLKGTGVASSSPLDLSVAPGSLSFGSVTASNPSPAQPIVVANNSSGTITVSGISVSRPFATAGNTLPTTLTAGQSMTVNVTFTPTASGTASGSLTITSTAANSPTAVSLAGTEATCNITFNPGENLPAIVSASAPGTTFCFTPGTYRMTTYITPKSNDVFIGSAPGAILNGSQLVTSWTSSGSYWVASNQPQLIAQTADLCLVSTSTACQFSDALFLDNQPLNRVMSLPEVVPGTFYRDYSSQQIYIADNPTGHAMEVIVCTHPILASGTGADGVTIQGLTIEKFAGDIGGAVQGNSTWIIQNDEVRLNHGDGIGADGKLWGNYSHNNGAFGVEGGYASTAMDVENNELAFNNWADFYNGGGAHFVYATNLIVRNNYSHDNNGEGFHTDGDSANVLYEYNHTKNNTNAGILHEISWDAIIRYNLLEDETSVFPQFQINGNSLWVNYAIGFSNSSNVQVYGNTITNCTNGIGGVLDFRGNSTLGPHTGQPYLLQNLEVHDNTFSKISNIAVGIVKSSKPPGYDNSVYTSWNNHFTNDTYILANSDGLYFTWMDTSGKHAYATYTWTQWQSFGNDVGGTLNGSNP
jgi:hypothetical protein